MGEITASEATTKTHLHARMREIRKFAEISVVQTKGHSYAMVFQNILCRRIFRQTLTHIHTNIYKSIAQLNAHKYTNPHIIHLHKSQQCRDTETPKGAI